MNTNTSNEDGTSMITLSYVPLFYPQWPLSELSTKWQQKKVIRSLIKFMDDAADLGSAEACCWSWREEDDVPHDPCPIFVLPQSSEICKHLNWWSQDKPEEFFQFAIYYDKEGRWYSCALMPNIAKSMSRMTFNIQEVAPELKVKSNSTAFFVPLSFGSEPMSVIDTLLDRGGDLPQDGDTIDVGLLDPALLNRACEVGDTPYDPDNIHWLRGIPVVNADKYLGQFGPPDDEDDEDEEDDTPDSPSRLWQCSDGKITRDLL